MKSIDITKEQMHQELLNAKQDIFYVIGEDRKIHTSNLHTNKTTCGKRIIQKYVSRIDYNKYFSCYECTC